MIIIFNLQALLVGILGALLGSLLSYINLISLSEGLYVFIGIMIISIFSEFIGFMPKLFFLPLGFISILIIMLALIDEKGSFSLILTIPLLLGYLAIKFGFFNQKEKEAVIE